MMHDEEEDGRPALYHEVATFEPVPSAARCTPEDWARKLGHLKVAPKHMPQLHTHFSWQHAAADVLHGWSTHAHHYQSEPLLLSEADYCAALDAAAEYPAKPAHEPAYGRTKKEGV